MEAGRELDALVAEKVFDAKLIRSEFHDDTPVVACEFPGRRTGDAFSSLPHYSTDIAAAWEVVEKLAPKLHIEVRQIRLDAWIAMFSVADDPLEPRGTHNGDSAPHAICLAALKAVEAR